MELWFALCALIVSFATPATFQGCSPGFVMNNDICVDINECEIYGACDQKCKNTSGSYVCVCDFPYELQADGKTCRIPAILTYTTEKGIEGIYVHDSQSINIVKNGPLETTAAGISVVDDFIYSSIFDKSSSICRISMNDHKLERLPYGEFSTAIEVDYITGNIYFVRVNFRCIRVCPKDGVQCRTLHQHDQHEEELFDKPKAIALSPENGLLFWTDWGKKPMIGKSGMDGSHPKEFVIEKVYWPNGVATDTPNGRLYWVDAKYQVIESIKFDGNDRKVVLSSGIKHPYSIAVFENKLYWSDWAGNNISECNKFTGKEKRHLVNGWNEKIIDIHVSLTSNRPIAVQRENPCAHSNCESFCLLAPSSNEHLNYTCVNSSYY